MFNNLRDTGIAYKKFEEKGGKNLVTKIIYDLTLFIEEKPHDGCDHYSLYSRAMDLLDPLKVVHPAGAQEAINCCESLREGKDVSKKDLDHLANLLTLIGIEGKEFLSKK